jgi:hypothetical protein
MIIIAEYNEETDSTEFIETLDGGKYAVTEAFECARAYLNSIECNHNQLDRTEA